MIIDFHTHIFPEKIAHKTVELLATNSDIVPYSDGTVAGLERALHKADADMSVALPVVTRPAQFDSILQFTAQINEDFKYRTPRILSFAGIHPACEDIAGKMKQIKELGFLGVKLHPDYQGTFIDDDAYVEIMNAARELDLVVVTHAGVDGAFLDQPIRCTPERVLRLLSRAPHKKLVLAHLGGNYLYDDVYEKLAGKDVYFDTSFFVHTLDRERFCKMLEKHGEDRILFASDSPWRDIKEERDIIESFGLPKAVEEKILGGNALSLLGI